MATAWVYGRGSTDKQVITMKVQAEGGMAYYASKLKPQGVAWGGIFADKATSSDRPLAERPAGKGLAQSLSDGDHIVLLDLDRAFRNFREAVNQLTIWRERKVTVHCYGQGIDTSTEVGILILSILAWVAEMEKRMIRERTRRAAAHRKKHNGASNQHAGYGFRLEGQRGHRRVVPDPAERQVMGLIVQLHDEKGLDFRQVYWALAKQGVRYRKGGKERMWSVSRIVRAYHAERKLAAASPSGGSASPARGRTPPTSSSPATPSPSTTPP